MIRILSISILLLTTTACNRAPKMPVQDVIVTLPVIGHIVSPLLGVDRVSVLLDGGETPHSYQPTPSDVQILSTAQLMVLAHPDVDGWARDFSTAGVSFVFNEDGHEEEEDEHPDAHFWSDPYRVLNALPSLSNTLCEQFPSECPAIRRRATAFSGRIDSVSQQIELQLQTSRKRCVVSAQPFMDHFLERFQIEHLGPITHEPGLSPLPRSFAHLADAVSHSACSSLLVQQAYSKGPYQTWADDMQLTMRQIDAVGTDASSYESYLVALAQAVLESSQ